MTGSVNLADIIDTVADGNDTLISSDNALSISDGKLNLSVKDTAGNEAKGAVNLADIADAVADGNTTYQLEHEDHDNNTTTITLHGSDDMASSVTVATRDTRNTVKAGENVTVAEERNNDGSSTYTVSAKADGKVERGNTRLVSGDTVYSETRLEQNGFVTKAENTAGENISAVDRQTRQNAEDISKINNKVNDIGGSINKLGAQINRVGAGAAALAALHPQDFDPDDKWDFAAGYGNYKDANAVAVGAFYRPTEDVMISVGGSFAGGENFVNAGVTVKLGQHNHVTRSKVAMAKEIIDLRSTVELLKKQNQQIMKALGNRVTPVLQDVNFPDVPKDHWAYSYVKYLADRGYVIGYPDGLFKGDRSMTRYEYAAIIYRALQKGAPVDADMGRSLGEFGPEIEKVAAADRFRVDRISGKDNDRHKVERVRVKDRDDPANKVFRDVYGSRIAKSETEVQP